MPYQPFQVDGIESNGYDDRSNMHALPISLATIHFLPRLLDLLEHGLVVERVFRCHVGGLVLERYIEVLDACFSQNVSFFLPVNGLGKAFTFEFVEDASHGTRAAAAGHCDVEFVVVFGHLVCWLCDMWLKSV